MWYSDRIYSKEELAILRELEQEMFKFNPGFRAMWHNDFEEYFKCTQDGAYWEKREEEREQELQVSMQRRIIEDPEYYQRMHEMAPIEEQFNGDLDPMATLSLRTGSGRALEEDEDFEYKRKWENDPLLKQAKEWMMYMLKTAGPLYDQTKNLALFRLLTNAPVVTGKIVFAQGGGMEYGPDDIGWRTDRVGYHLSLISLNRCIESLQELQQSDLHSQLPLDEYLHRARPIRQELIDRLEHIVSSRR